MEIVKILVDNGADVDSLNQVTGKTPTHIAVERNLEDMVNFLVKDAQVKLSRRLLLLLDQEISVN